MKYHLPMRRPVLDGWVRLVFLGFAMWLRERALRLEAEERARKFHRAIDTLYQADSQKEKALAQLRKENLFLSRYAFRILGELADNYHTYHSPGALYRSVEVMIGEIGGGPEGRKRLIRFLDSHLDRHPVTALRRALPRLKGEYIALFCYLILQFRPKLIIELMNPDKPQTVYSMRYRLIRRILRLGPARSKRFMDLLS